MEEASFKRVPAEELSVEDFTGKEKRAAVIGRLKELNRHDLKAKLSGETKGLKLLFKDLSQMKGISEGSTVRVIGVPAGDSLEVETVHELKGFDAQLFEKVKRIELRG